MIKTIGILTSGGDAPGMNAAIRAVVRAALKKGIKVYGIRRGYCGLIDGDIFEMDEMSVSNITHKGGTMLYTARSVEFRTEEGMQIAKANCEKYGLEGIVVIGGDGSFRGAADLSARGILTVGLPGTIDNDIACTEYTIGYDTAMNTAMEMIDKLQDTCQSHDRCCVVEVMGRGAGFIAVNTAVACGAIEIITKEVPYDLDQIAKDMLECKKNGKQNFIIVVSENVGHSQEIATAIQEKTSIEARATVLGHVQRGGSPTVRDRVVASEMGYYAVELLDQGIGNRNGIHHSTQHTHGIGVAALHLVRAVLDTPPEVARANHKPHLHAHLGAFLDGSADGIDHFKIQAPVCRTRKGLTTDLEHNSLVFDLRQVLPLLSYPFLF